MYWSHSPDFNCASPPCLRTRFAHARRTTWLALETSFFFGALQYTTLSPSTFVLTLFACETMNSCRKQFGKKESSFSTLDFVIWSGFCLNFSTLPEECLLAKPVAQLRVLAQECQYLLAISSFFLTFLLLLSLLLLLFLLLLFRYSSSCVALIHGGLFTKAAIICDKNFTRFPVFFGKYFQSFGESSEARPIFGSMVVNVDRLVKQKKLNQSITLRT